VTDIEGVDRLDQRPRLLGRQHIEVESDLDVARIEVDLKL